MKIDTLEDDINKVLRTGEGWTEEISLWVANDIQKTLNRQMNKKPMDRGTLRLSNLGKPCKRQLWYSLNVQKDSAEQMQGSTYAKFIFGDMIESFLIGLTMASGHKVEGMQDELSVCGIKGHRDVVIDGMTVDIKTASSRSFDKFKNHQLRENDSFGYISQISSYVYAAKDDPKVTYKTEGAFLAFDKQFGHVTLDRYDLTEDLANKENEAESLKTMVKQPEPPDRIEDYEVPYNKSGNMKLNTVCSYCEFKNICHPDLRTFIYSNGPIYMTKVEKEPNGKVLEVT